VLARSRRSALAELREQERQLDVLARGEHGDQVEELEDEPDVLGAEARELVVRTSRSARGPPP
jgi:hypothetical protein